ncbi:hypothetical protein [Nostoc sp. UHCC 0251]|uniref:hypothetical protein n=1 Tax=Nostoc sp. UHCC 0251 TaxID=3110240 RepID=UPI002B22147E|nr:hypothetical protein [Nostoc sp. UHCC 0251]
MGVKEFDDKSNLASGRSDRSSSYLLNSTFALLKKFSDRYSSYSVKRIFQQYIFINKQNL